MIFRTYLLISLLAISSFLYADTPHDAAIKQGIRFTLNMDFDAALALYERMIVQEPKDPAGYFLKSAVYFWMFSEDTKDESIAERFEEASYKAVEAAEERLDESEDDRQALFYLGGAYGNLGRYYVMTGSWTKAYWYGKKGNSALEDLAEIDSTFYDVYLGLGIFNYYADVLPKFIKVVSYLLGINGDKKLGIEQLNLAISRGKFTSDEARYFLAIIYTQFELDYEQAASAYNLLIEKYPKNTTFLFSYAWLLVKMSEYDKALQLFERIAKNREIKNSTIPLKTAFFQGYIYHQTNRPRQARHHFSKVLELGEGRRHWTKGWAAFNLAESYELDKQRTKALIYYKQVREEDNEHAYSRAETRIETPLSGFEITMQRAVNYRNFGHSDSSLYLLTDLKALTESNPGLYENIPELYYNLGLSYAAQDDYKNALFYLKTVVQSEMDMDDWVKPWANYHLGDALLKSGEPEKAKLYFNRVLKIDYSPRLTLLAEHQLESFE